MNKPDITKMESGLQQNDGLKPSKSPSLDYGGDSRMKANDIGDRSEHDDDVMKEAMVRARDNRRDQPQEEIGDFADQTSKKH